MKRLSILLFVLAAFVFVSSFTAIAAAEPMWAIRCNKESKDKGVQRGSCEIFQSLTIKENNKRFVEAAISYPKGKDKARGVFVVPLGILLQSGLIMKVDDGKPYKFQVRYCDVGGCFGFVDLSEEILDTMRGGKKMQISFQALNKRKINVEFDLKGFSETLKKVS